MFWALMIVLALPGEPPARYRIQHESLEACVVALHEFFEPDLMKAAAQMGMAAARCVQEWGA